MASKFAQFSQEDLAFTIVCYRLFMHGTIHHTLVQLVSMPTSFMHAMATSLELATLFLVQLFTKEQCLLLTLTPILGLMRVSTPPGSEKG